MSLYISRSRGGSAFGVKFTVRCGPRTSASDQSSRYRTWVSTVKALLRTRPFDCLNSNLPSWPGDYYSNEAYLNGLASEDDLYAAYKQSLKFYLTVNTVFFDILLEGLDLSGPMQPIDLMALDDIPFCKGARRSGTHLVAWVEEINGTSSVEAQLHLSTLLATRKLPSSATSDQLREHFNIMYGSWAQVSGNGKANAGMFFHQVVASLPTDPLGSLVVQVRTDLVRKMVNKDPILTDPIKAIHLLTSLAIMLRPSAGGSSSTTDVSAAATEEGEKGGKGGKNRWEKGKPPANSCKRCDVGSCKSTDAAGTKCHVFARPPIDLAKLVETNQTTPGAAEFTKLCRRYAALAGLSTIKGVSGMTMRQALGKSASNPD